MLTTLRPLVNCVFKKKKKFPKKKITNNNAFFATAGIKDELQIITKIQIFCEKATNCTCLK